MTKASSPVMQIEKPAKSCFVLNSSTRYVDIFLQIVCHRTHPFKKDYVHIRKKEARNSSPSCIQSKCHHTHNDQHPSSEKRIKQLRHSTLENAQFSQYKWSKPVATWPRKSRQSITTMRATTIPKTLNSIFQLFIFPARLREPICIAWSR